MAMLLSYSFLQMAETFICLASHQLFVQRQCLRAAFSHKHHTDWTIVPLHFFYAISPGGDVFFYVFILKPWNPLKYIAWDSSSLKHLLKLNLKLLIRLWLVFSILISLMIVRRLLLWWSSFFCFWFSPDGLSTVDKAERAVGGIRENEGNCPTGQRGSSWPHAPLT